MKYTAVDATQMCDECGKNVTKIWRVENKHKYCANCYMRVFKLSDCPKCGNLARLNKYNENAICAACIRAKPCARCGKTEYKSGKLTPYGLVCNSCAPHFRDKEPCESCGKLSSSLSKNFRLGNTLRLCPKCFRADHGTCQACHRHRLLTSSDGRMLCKTCMTLGEKACSQCQQLMPAGYGKICESCYWQGLLQKRTVISCEALKIYSSRFGLFASWLGDEVGAHKAAISVNRYLAFFIEIENSFNSFPNYEKLINHFGAAKLRKVVLPMRWMAFLGLITVNAELREDNTEKRRISALLDKLGAKTAERRLLDCYYQLLLVDLEHGKTTLRSIRLSLSPASSLLAMSTGMKLMPPNQKALDAYLHKSAGQRAAVSGFVNYLRDIHGANIRIPALDSGMAKRNRKKKLEAEMLALLKVGGNSGLNREWLSVALAYFHGLPKKVGKTVPDDNILDSGDGGVTVLLNGLKYWVQAH